MFVGALSAASMTEDDVDVVCSWAVMLRGNGNVVVDVDSVTTSLTRRVEVVVVDDVIVASSFPHSGSCLISTLMSDPTRGLTSESTSELA